MQLVSRRRLDSGTRNQLTGLAFVLPLILGFLFLNIYPMVASFYYSLTQDHVVCPARFTGLENYRELLLYDEMFRIVLRNTSYLVVVGVPAATATAFLLATLLNTKIRGRSIFRTIFFIPSIVPVVSTVMTWLWIYNSQYGLIDGFLMANGFAAVPWLTDPNLAKPSLIIMQCWAVGGSFVIFLAALQDVPREMYEAAVMDGAGQVMRFLRITVPMRTPAILFVGITGLIGSLQQFVTPYLLTNGGPNNATELYAVYLYRNAFEFFKMGYASAMAWILFVVTLGLSLLVFRTSARWVYYAGA